MQEDLLIRHAEHEKNIFYVHTVIFLLENKTVAVIFIIIHDYLSCVHFYTGKYCWFLAHSLSILIATVQLIN